MTDPIDRVFEIERLAALDPIAYEVGRIEAAERLGFRAEKLDKFVKKTRRKLGLDKDEDDDGQGKAVTIADVVPWLDPVDGDHVASALAQAFKMFAVLPEHVPEVIALWILHTHTVNAFTISPRLAITSPTKGCGKTTILRLLNHMNRRPKRAGSISPPALFRVVEMFQPTVLLDETEKYIEHGGDLHALLNEGHAVGGKVLRVLGDKLELREFNLFGPVAFARNGKLPDDLEQRSIIIEMKRRLPDEQLAELRDDRAESLQRVARMCARWAEDNEDEIKEADPDMGELINRIADNWRPLFAIADTIGGEWPEIAREAAAALAPKESDSTATMLLFDIKLVFDEHTDSGGQDRLFSEVLAERLAVMEGRPWAEFGKARKPITKHQLAHMLKGFKVTPEKVRVGSKTLQGYYRHRFEEAWTRYLAPTPTPQGVNEPEHRNNPTAAGTTTTFQSGTRNGTSADCSGTAGDVPIDVPPDVPVQKCEKPLRPNGCSGVPVDLPPGSGAGDTDNLTIHDPDQVCAQCNAPNDLEPHQHAGGQVWLHEQCVRFWKADEDLGIPDFLDRRGQSG